MPEPLRNADIDLRLGRWRSAVENLLKGGDATQACALAAKKRLFPHALAVAAAWEREHSQDAARTEDALSEEPRERSRWSRRRPGPPRRRVRRRGGDRNRSPRCARPSPPRTPASWARSGATRTRRWFCFRWATFAARCAPTPTAAPGAPRWRSPAASRFPRPSGARSPPSSRTRWSSSTRRRGGGGRARARRCDRAASLLCAARKWRDVRVGGVRQWKRRPRGDGGGAGGGGGGERRRVRRARGARARARSTSSACASCVAPGGAGEGPRGRKGGRRRRKRDPPAGPERSANATTTARH